MTTNKPTTYFELSQQNAEAEVRGRFAAERPYTVGSEPTTANAPLPPSPIDWSVDGVEPPLGEMVDAVPDMLTQPHGGSALAAPQAECPYAGAEGCHLERNDI